MELVSVGRAALVIALVLSVVLLGLRLARHRHEGRADATWRSLDEAGDGTVFSPTMLDGLPDPARRYLLRAITPGTPLAGSVRLSMTGTLRTKPGGRELALEAEQILGGRGLVWRARAGSGPASIVGFDRYLAGEGEMRWWLAAVLPVASAGGVDVSRSAAGRVAGESVLLPSALLPIRGARWEAVDDGRARVTRRIDGEDITLTLAVDGDGRLTDVTFLRWHDDAGAGEPGLVRFDVAFTGEITSGGYRIPAEMRAGWRMGAPDGFPFFRAVLTDVRYR
jgi:hypothetical protein